MAGAKIPLSGSVKRGRGASLCLSSKKYLSQRIAVPRPQGAGMMRFTDNLRNPRKPLRPLLVITYSSRKKSHKKTNPHGGKRWFGRGALPLFQKYYLKSKASGPRSKGRGIIDAFDIPESILNQRPDLRIILLPYRPRVDNAHEPVDPRPLLDLDRLLFPRFAVLLERHVQEMRRQKLIIADDLNLPVL